MTNWFLSLNFMIQLLSAFTIGIIVGLLLMNVFIIVKN